VPKLIKNLTESKDLGTRNEKLEIRTLRIDSGAEMKVNGPNYPIISS
jgi:hypothetical protein